MEELPRRASVRQEIMRWLPPFFLGVMAAYGIALLDLMFADSPDGCANFEPFSAPGVHGFEREFQWWPPAWDCRARGADGTLLRFRREWGASDAAWFAFWTFAVAGAWVLLRRLRLRRRPRGPRGTGPS